MYRAIPILVALFIFSGCMSRGAQSPGGDYDQSDATPGKAHLELAMAYLRAGNRRQARYSLNRALELERRSAAVHNGFGLLYHAEGEYELAEKSFRQALSIDRKFSQAHYNYGHFLAMRGRYDEALRNYSRAADDVNYPLRANAFASMGQIYLRLGRRELARAAFADALRRDSSLHNASRALVIMSHEDGKYRDVLLYSREISSFRGHSRQTIMAAIDAARRLGDQQAEQTYRLFLQQLDDNDER